MERSMRVLIAGAGVIGTVYAAHLAGAGHAVSVLSHPPRTEDVARNGLVAHDVLEGSRAAARVSVVPDAAGTPFDLVLVAVRSDQLAAACARLTGLTGSPAVVFFGNNPGGRAAICGQVHGDVMLGFPGVGGTIRGGTAEYARIPQQPTALQTGGDPAWMSWPGRSARAGSRSSAWLTWTGGSPTTRPSWPALPQPCTGVAPIPAAWQPTARPSGSCAQPSPRPSPPCAKE